MALTSREGWGKKEVQKDRTCLERGHTWRGGIGGVQLEGGKESHALE